MFCNHLVFFYSGYIHGLLSFIKSHMKAQIKTPIAVGLALGIFFGIVLFIFAITARIFGYGRIFVSFMSTFYIGYKANILGAFIGLLRGFIEAFVWWCIITRLVGYFQKAMK